MTLRKQLLDGPSDLLDLPDGGTKKLAALGFTTVREAFRAALAGRLSARQPAQAAFEEEVLLAACRLLGHPAIHRKTITDFPLPPGRQTIGEAIASLNGGPFTIAPPLLASSIRELLLPLPFHRATEGTGATTIGVLLALPLEALRTASNFPPRQVGALVAHLFDFFFLLNTPLIGAPTPSHPQQGEDLAAELQLTPWFTMTRLRAGRELLDSAAFRHTLVLGQNAGAIFIEDGRPYQVLLGFSESSRYRAGFSIDRAHCELCGRTRGKQSLCHHAAALTLAMLATPTPGRPRPHPLLFPTTPWQLAVDILFDLYGPAPPSHLEVQRHHGHWHLSASGDADFRSVSWHCNDSAMGECVALFGHRLPDSKPAATATAAQLRALFIDLAKISATPAADDDAGPPTPSAERAASFWGWLATTMALAYPACDFRLEGPDENTLFALSAHEPIRGEKIFSLTLPRARTPDVLDGLARLGHCQKVPELHAFTRLSLDREAAALRIESCLRLSDGSTLLRHELEPLRYGRYYYIKGLGFITVCEQAEAHRLSNRPLAVATVDTDAAPDFLAAHREALDAEENDVEPALRHLTVRQMPERLDLAGCRLDDDWCYLAGHYGVGNRTVSLADLLIARRQGKKFIATDNHWLRLDDTPLAWFHDLGEGRVWHDENGRPGGVRLSKPEMLMLSALVGEVHTDAAAPVQEADLIGRLLNVAAWQDPRQLPVVPIHLRHYQRNGLAWLFHLHQHGMGGVLADDMGLGKTHQALALLQAVQAEKSGRGRFLVVCPATVVSHWLEKAGRYYPELDCHVYHGATRDIATAAGHSVLFTTYGIIRRDIERFAALAFDIVIFDEVQHLKNKKTELHKAARALSGRMTVGLTGTPLENSVGDIKAIFDLCLPGLLGSDAFFRKQYVLPIEEQDNRERRDTLAHLIQPFLLRRTKDQVLTELPDVIDDIRTCELSADQIALYREVVEQRGRALVDHLHAADSRSLPYMEVLAVINYLKQICDHPALVAAPDPRRRYRSGKWDLFVELLDECLASAMKVVVFSHYTRMLDIIEQHLERSGIDYCGLRGSMPLARRQQMIQRFNTDPGCKVFCASLLAGGVGVDLTAAQAVIHYDRWWNAAREDQATSRVHRMGQRHVVQSFKLITVGTLEEKIHRLIHRKRDLAQHLVREDDAAMIKRLSREELIELIQWHTDPPAASPPRSTSFRG